MVCHRMQHKRKTETMKIYRDVYRQMLTSFPTVPPETGGIMGSSDEGIITDFIFDRGTPIYDKAVYTPDVFFLNHIIAAWGKEGIRFCGIIHSHPDYNESLSLMDELYIQTVMDQMPKDKCHLYFPIMIPFRKIIPFVASNTGRGLIIQAKSLKIYERGEHCDKGSKAGDKIALREDVLR